MKRRTRPPVVRQAPLPSPSIYHSVLKQSQSRAAALASGTRDFRKLLNDEGDAVPDDNAGAVHSVSYSDELMDAFKRKTQELCDETREQYEQKLERQEAQHERQMQNFQRQLRDVVGTSVSLVEHEQILATTTKEQQRQLEEIRRRYQSEVRELEQRIEQKWQAKVALVKTQHEQDKSALMQRIEELERHKTDAAAKAKERELSELRWGEKLEVAGRAKADVEKQVDELKKRLEDACRIIVALKTRLRHHARLARDLESQREKTIELRDEVMKCKLSYAELKGDTDTQVASLEKELAHAQYAVANEKTNTCALQNEVAELRGQLQRQQCTAVELTTKGELSAEHYATERKQLHHGLETLRQALQHETEAVKAASTRMDKMQQKLAESQLQHQTLVQDLQTRLELQKTSGTSLKRQTQRLKQRVEQFKTVVEKLYDENKKLSEEAHNRDASTEAWAKKLFGRQ